MIQEEENNERQEKESSNHMRVVNREDFLKFFPSPEEFINHFLVIGKITRSFSFTA